MVFYFYSPGGTISGEDASLQNWAAHLPQSSAKAPLLLAFTAQNRWIRPPLRGSASPVTALEVLASIIIQAGQDLMTLWPMWNYGKKVLSGPWSPSHPLKRWVYLRYQCSKGGVTASAACFQHYRLGYAYYARSRRVHRVVSEQWARQVQPWRLVICCHSDGRPSVLQGPRLTPRRTLTSGS